MALLLAANFPAAASAQQPVPTTSAPLVFDRVTVVDVVEGKLIPAQRVVVIGNRIQSVGDTKAVQTPKGAQVVDARGKYLIPGLWDLHVHEDRYGVDLYYPLLVANGITAMRDPASSRPLDTLTGWRREILAGTRVGPPRQILSGKTLSLGTPCVREASGGPWATEIFHTCVADSADARHLVDSLRAAGSDMIKPYELSKDMYFVIAAEARRIGAPFGGHVRAPGLTAIEASDSGALIIDHVISALYGVCFGDNEGQQASIDRCAPVAERFRHNNTWWVPTLTAAVGYKSLDELPPASLAVFERFEGAISSFWGSPLLLGPDNWLRGSNAPADSSGILHIARQVGLPILAGTDAWGVPRRAVLPPGFSLHAELAMLVAEGLTPLAALQAATINPAKLLRGTDSLGTIAAGKLADLVLLDADPLADITNTTTIRAVVANGRYFDRAAIDRILTEVKGTR